MPSTDEILKAARDLGELISNHDAAKKLENVLNRLGADQDAQRLLTDYNRHLQTLAEKEMNQQPIEVSDKARLSELQKKVVTHPILRELQKAQMDYVDLLRQVDEVITGGESGVQSPTPSVQNPLPQAGL